MSFPVAIPDRRLLRRRTCRLPCIIHLGPGGQTLGVVRQLDSIGARIRLTEAVATIPAEVRVVLNDGVEFHAAVTWRIGDTLGLRRKPRNARRADAFQLDQAA
ncbi:MAG: hypothetical protein ACI8Y6_001815 [Brevundimonas sp.]|jgi:hypothetical protein